MITLLQRVSEARVDVAGTTIAKIDNGLLVLVGVQAGDDEAGARHQLDRLLNYRVFADNEGKMNLSLRDVQGGLLLVPQFTLAADTKKGTRASFTKAAPPEKGAAYFEKLVQVCRRRLPTVETGTFGADMQVSLVNDGPVTFWLES